MSKLRIDRYVEATPNLVPGEKTAGLEGKYSGTESQNVALGPTCVVFDRHGSDDVKAEPLM